MRSIPLRPGETFITGDTEIVAESTEARMPPISDPTPGPSLGLQRIDNPTQHQSNQQWLADYEREERRLAGGRVR